MFTYFVKGTTSKLYNNKYTITSAQITNTKILAFIAVPVVVFKLPTRKNRKVGQFLRKQQISRVNHGKNIDSWNEKSSGYL